MPKDDLCQDDHHEPILARMRSGAHGAANESAGRVQLYVAGVALLEELRGLVVDVRAALREERKAEGRKR